MNARTPRHGAMRDRHGTVPAGLKTTLSLPDRRIGSVRPRRMPQAFPDAYMTVVVPDVS